MGKCKYDMITTDCVSDSVLVIKKKLLDIKKRMIIFYFQIQAAYSGAL